MSPRALAGRFYHALLRGLAKTGCRVRHCVANDRLAGVRLSWRADEPELLRGAVRSVNIGEERLSFFIEDDLDAVQSHHRRGEIYEPEELSIIARHYREDSTFVDVGGNVGNHAVYAARMMGARKVIVFEADPLAVRICQVNIALNECSDRIMLKQLALSDTAGEARPHYFDHNLGGTRLSLEEGGPVTLIRGDDVLADETDIGFIKIDVEGFELRVLGGLLKTIERFRPNLFVEVENNNIELFKVFCDRNGYVMSEEFRRYDVCTNFLALPKRD